MPRDRLAPEPALSDVVRQRLAALLDEVPARRAIDPDRPGPGDRNPPGRAGVGVWSARPEAVGPTSPPGTGPPLVDAPPTDPRRSRTVPQPTDAPGSRTARQPADASGSRTITLPTDAPGPPTAAPSGPAPPLRWARAAWEFSRHHLVAVGVVLLTGCLWAGYNVLQARSTPVTPLPPPSVVASASPTPATAPMLVHVLGAVRRPGVVSLPEGSRVLDAIAAAGGLTAEADPAELNLAAVVSDGSQLVIGVAGEPRGEVRGAAAGGGTEAGEVSLNTATQAELEALPGVGPVTASRIIAWREEHGRFSSVEELQEVSGIGPKTYAQLAGHVRV